MQVWTQVKVKTEGHARFDQAGTVQEFNPETPDQVGVRFDEDDVIEAVQVSDLQVL